MTGNPKLDKIILGINGVVALAAAGLVYFAHFQISPPPTDQKAEEDQLIHEAHKAREISQVTLPQQVVNLYNEGSTRLRFLSVELSILLFRENDKALIKEKEFLIKNALIEVASHMTPDEISTLSGRILFESRIKKRVNEEVGFPLIKKIYFGKFTVQ
jgi:flagellar protein FliL